MSSVTWGSVLTAASVGTNPKAGWSRWEVRGEQSSSQARQVETTSSCPWHAGSVEGCCSGTGVAGRTALPPGCAAILFPDPTAQKANIPASPPEVTEGPRGWLRRSWTAPAQARPSLHQAGRRWTEPMPAPLWRAPGCGLSRSGLPHVGRNEHMGACIPSVQWG